MGLGPGDILYRTLVAFVLSDIYYTSANWFDDWRLHVCRWAGVVAFVVGAAKALVLILEDRWSEFRSRRRRGHWVVVGDGDLADALVYRKLGQGIFVHWVTETIDQGHFQHPRLFIVEGSPNPISLKRARLQQASCVVVSVSDDSQALSIAGRIRSDWPDERKLSIWVHVQSPWLDLHVDRVPNASKLLLVSTARSAVRACLRQYPPYQLAARQQHTTLHILILGFGAYGESVLVETLLSCLTLSYLKPTFTIIDPNGESIRSRLALKYPELSKCAVINVIPMSLQGPGTQLTDDDFKALDQSDPISVCYVCLPEVQEALPAALMLDILAKRHNIPVGPIFVRQHNRTDRQPAAVAQLPLNTESGRIVEFGDFDSIVDSISGDYTASDRLPQALHRGYCDLVPDDSIANVPWAQLSEDRRDSNRRSADHVLAKLVSLVDASSVDFVAAEFNAKGTVAALDIEATPDDIEALAMLEHQRWMADRRINGWQYHSVRQDERRMHNALIPFDTLSEDNKAHDRLMVKLSLSTIGVTVPDDSAP